MSRFTDMPALRPLPDGKHWQMKDWMKYHLEATKIEFLGRDLQTGETKNVVTSDTFVMIPNGFITDFGSIPRIFWSIIPPWGIYGPACIVHDYLYGTQVMIVEGIITPVDRKTADEIFLEAMQILEVPKWKRTIMYVAVRASAGPAWDHYAEMIDTRKRKGDRWDE